MFFKMFMALHVGLYRLTGGMIGGSMNGGKIVLLTTTGRKTGKARTVPIMFILDESGNPVVCASYAGAPTNPAWFENLKAKPEVTYQIGGDVKRARADIAEPELRNKLWAALTAKYKGFLEYEKKTTRVIPMVTLRPIA